VYNSLVARWFNGVQAVINRQESVQNPASVLLTEYKQSGKGSFLACITLARLWGGKGWTPTPFHYIYYHVVQIHSPHFISTLYALCGVLLYNEKPLYKTLLKEGRVTASNLKPLCRKQYENVMKNHKGTLQTLLWKNDFFLFMCKNCGGEGMQLVFTAPPR
jgi:hypothetical protein